MDIKPSKQYLNQERVLGGKGMIFTTPASNGNYYFRCWVASANKYYRKGLRTKDRAEAMQKGETIMVDILSKTKAGHKLFGLYFKEVCDLFLEHSKEREKGGKITKQRVDTLQSQINKWILPYIGLKTLCSNLTKHSFIDYSTWKRKETNYKVKEVTLRNEMTTINAICRFAYQRDFMPIERFNLEEIKITEPARRDTFEVEEYESFYRGMRKWVKEASTEKEKYIRTLVQHFILIKSNSLMRFGEIINLKWSMCKTYEYKGERMLEINLPKHICKNRKSRKLLTVGGRYLDRYKRLCEFTEPDDYVFNDYYIRNRISRFHMYKQWKSLLKYTKMDDLKNPDGSKKIVTYYSLRHLGITFRLMSGVSIYEVSELAGTEVRFIQLHYSHLDITKMRDSALKTFRRTADGAIVPLLSDERDIDFAERKLR